MVCAEAGTEGGILWNGPSTSRTLPASVPRPELLHVRDWTDQAYAYRAEPYAFTPNPIVSPRPVLTEDPSLPETWWKEMTAALDALADVPPPADREAVREEYLRRVIPEFTGHQVDDVTWTTAHGDLHWANITRTPHILDWEGWGRAPYGYDAATLYVYTLLTPETAAPIRTRLACVLDRPEARHRHAGPCAPRSSRPRTASTSTPSSPARATAPDHPVAGPRWGRRGPPWFTGSGRAARRRRSRRRAGHR
ncbi:phosphotransferase [Streptomyces spororaveus]|uniref:Phosphotransferase family enzyme n=1 Tax=Streptomyces spororaveus TaxID=284039 RepID=A0ABQ3TQ44_9ACTN|nr:phosphotransferase [Streptomyces spororaveus]GHI82541.1 hypothetical protein Sspor_81020 [Streptomyces spororaveus]